LRRTKRWWAAIGTAGLVTFFAIVLVQGAQKDELLENGVWTTGIVVEDPAENLRCGQVPVPIRFSDGEVVRTEPFFVSGCGGGGLRKGQTVDVVYDPGSPATFLVDTRPSDEPIPTMAAVVGLVGGGFFAGGALIRGRRLRRMRKVLEAYPWRECQVEISDLVSPWVRYAMVVGPVGDDVRPVMVAMTGLTSLRGVHEVRLAGPAGGPEVLAAEDSVLAFLRTARSASGRRRAQRSIESGRPSAGA
jgi:hypothetical protein